MAQEIRLTTTGTLSPVPIADFGGRSFPHPTVNFNLLTEFSEDEIKASRSASGSLQAAVDAGYITLSDQLGNPITIVEEASAHEHEPFVGDTGTGGVKGFVPAPAAGDATAGKYLDSDGTWTVPPASSDEKVGVSADDTTPGYLLDKITTTTTAVEFTEVNPGANEDLQIDVADMVGDSGAGGVAGLAPAPGVGDAAAGKYLDADGTWTTPPDNNTTDASGITYTPGDVTDWNGDVDPGDVDDALDQLASRVEDTEGNVSTLQTDVAALESGYSRRKAVIDIVDPTAAPPTEVNGDRYILGFDVGANDAGWDGAAKGDIVQFNGTTWDATTPIEGYVAYVDNLDKDALYVDDGVPDWELRDPAAILSSNTPQAVGSAGSAGSSGMVSRDDHVHAHGNKAGGLLHAIATTVVNGFMSALDKVKLDGIATNANNYTHPNHSGHVTSAGDGATTIQPNVVANSMLEQAPLQTMKGNDLGVAGNVKDLTLTEIMALLQLGGNAEIVTGTYTGDGTLSQAIVGIKQAPKFLKVWEFVTTGNTAIDSFETTDTMVDDNVLGVAVNMANGKTVLAAIVSLDADGFTVGDQAGPSGGNHPNKLGTVYNYLAIG